jgi:glycerol-3-phosphate O-acyltransferase
LTLPLSGRLGPCSGTVAVPLWLLVLIVGFAAVSFATHFLFPSVRWFFPPAGRTGAVAAERPAGPQDRPVQAGAAADMVARLAYDPKVSRRRWPMRPKPGCRAKSPSKRPAAMRARSCRLFGDGLFRLWPPGRRKGLSRGLFRVRVGKVDPALGHLDPKATVIFVMNHRSNMDYVLVTWLVADRSAFLMRWANGRGSGRSAALIRAMGAYFIRRGSRNTLYRKVLARYVQMATEEGTTQAIFPEGGLSLDGRVGPAKMGLLSYIVEGWGQCGARCGLRAGGAGL